MAAVRKGYRTCTKCHKNKSIAKGFKTPRGRVCKTCQRGGRHATTKNARLQETFNITHDQWLELLKHNNGLCWICFGKRPMLDTDHDHALQKLGVPIEETIRGLLCRRCNRRLLPSCKDDVEILKRAIWYLTHARHVAQDVLRLAAEGYTQDEPGRWARGEA